MVLLGSGHSRLEVEDRHHVHLEAVTGKGSVMVEGIGPVAEDRGYLHTARGRHKGVVLGALHIPRSLAAGEVGYSYHRNTLVQTC